MVADAPVPDLRYSQTWGIEDSLTGVAGLVIGRIDTAQKAAFSLCEKTAAPVDIYWVDEGTWRLYAKVKP